VSRWYHEITSTQWRVLAAAQLGWVLDAMDMLLYSFALTGIRAEFHLTAAAAGGLAAAPLVTSAAGGALFGSLSDQYGRARALAWSILTFSVFTALTATSQTPGQLLFWRILAGIGLGGEWAAGSVLIAETWPPQHRAKGIGFMQSGWAIGYLAAAVLGGLVLPRWGWRPLFLMGVSPALFTWWIRRNISEPNAWKHRAPSPSPPLISIFRPPARGRVAIFTALCSALIFGYWGLFTWLPAFLSSPVERGGAGLSILRTSGWIIPMQVGAFLGYTLFGFLADRFGQRLVFLMFVGATVGLVPLYGLLGRNAAALIALGPLVGFFGHGYFSALGVIGADLFPPAIRATAQGFCYNTGRALSALAPITIGAIADQRGIGAALGFTSIFFAMGAGLMLLMPRQPVCAAVEAAD
jgi:MFS family permease